MLPLYLVTSPLLAARIDPIAWEARLAYSRTMQRAVLMRLWSRLTRRPNRLLDPGPAMRMLARRLYVATNLHTPINAVSVDRIVGSVRLAPPFDRRFLPQPGHSRQQWLGLAHSWLRGQELPPVELLQVEDVYLVRDGHHQVSVARALGHQAIDAILWAVPASQLCPAARREITANRS